MNLLIQVASVPWKSVFLSIRVWALILAKCLCLFGYNVIASKLPSYLESVLRMDMTKNGLINAMVYVTMAITSPIGGPLSDYVRRKEIISVTAIRKIFQSIGNNDFESKGFSENKIVCSFYRSNCSSCIDTNGWMQYNACSDSFDIFDVNSWF